MMRYGTHSGTHLEAVLDPDMHLLSWIPNAAERPFLR